MKKFSVPVLALAAVLLAPMTAQAQQTPGWYAGAGFGGTFTPDLTTRPSTGNNTIQFDNGWNVNVNGGYAWSNGLRLEGEYFHSRADVEKVTPGIAGNGHLSHNNLFGNVYYDWHNSSMFTPYIGGGVGIAFADADQIGPLSNGGNLNDGSTEFAYQAIGGVSAQLDTNWAVTADYRYIATTEPRYNTTAGGSARTDNESHNVVVGLRYSFAQPAAYVEPAPAAARPAPRAASKPVVAPVPESYMVFFDFDKSDITPEAKRILASAAQEFKSGGTVKIVVTGHTDTVGTAQYNQGLSVRRANAVKAELDALGVPSGVVKAKGVGKTGLLVPTADGVREAQNRRAEILFDKE
ncbi:MAG: OmpA family protein [Alphaproteobacteria bacterium]